MFEKSLKIIPDMPDTLYYKAVVLGKMGKIEEAKRTFEKILKIDSNNQYGVKGLEWLKKKQIRLETGK